MKTTESRVTVLVLSASPRRKGWTKWWEWTWHGATLNSMDDNNVASPEVCRCSCWTPWSGWWISTLPSMAQAGPSLIQRESQWSRVNHREPLWPELDSMKILQVKHYYGVLSNYVHHRAINIFVTQSDQNWGLGCWNWWGSWGWSHNMARRCCQSQIGGQWQYLLITWGADLMTEWQGLTTDEDSNSSEDEFSELEGEELVESLQRRLEHELGLVEGTTAYEKVAASSRLTWKEWKKIESNQKLGYSKVMAMGTLWLHI